MLHWQRLGHLWRMSSVLQFQKCLLQGKAAGVNLSVNICNLHGIPSFSLDFIGFSPGLQGLFAASWLPKEKDFAII